MPFCPERIGRKFVMFCDLGSNMRLWVQSYPRSFDILRAVPANSMFTLDLKNAGFGMTQTWLPQSYLSLWLLKQYDARRCKHWDFSCETDLWVVWDNVKLSIVGILLYLLLQMKLTMWLMAVIGEIKIVRNTGWEQNLYRKIILNSHSAHLMRPTADS